MQKIHQNSEGIIITSKKWVYKNYDEDIVSRLSVQYDISRLAAAVLQNRGNLLNNGLQMENKFYSYSLLKDIEKAVDRITKALQSGERITIYGDYDADGITSTAILYMYLTDRGANADFYIPERESEGYGINLSALDIISEKGTKLVITVDTGVTAHDEIEYAKSLGMDVIVTDHHECKNVIPECHAVINPKRDDCEYPFKELVGAGVVFKLIEALEGGKNKSLLFDRYAGLVCLATVADVAPLVSENRAFVSIGLKNLASGGNIGINALLKATKLDGKPITAGHVGFILAPRLNAAGRLSNANKSLELLLCADEQKAFEIAMRLSEENEQRQQIGHEIFLQAVELIECNNLHKNNVIVVAKEGWHQGVIGIVSSKITERYYRPSFLISIDKKNAKGSGRSISGFNLFEALTYSKDYLSRYGGHALAAGLSLSSEKIDAFSNKINKFAEGVLSEEDFEPILYIDSPIQKEDINLKTVEHLSLLEPFGMGNAQPIFSYNNAKVSYITTLSGGKHLKMVVDKEGIKLEAIGFSMGDKANEISFGDVVNVAGNLNVNIFRGEKKVQLVIKDIKKQGFQ
ncbi:MAG: single-stranded-DNA-specific exonuclease RecJ [Firmicutes bacterium]|nr:single-stranded-DNA-specific exonuclease RecJ [Bacillota bacterium]